MSVYATPIITAVIVLLIIGFITAIPWIIHNYRKYGFFSFWTSFIIFSFVFYALSAYFLVILPLPEVRDSCGMLGYSAKKYQLIPFYFVYEILRESNIVWSQPSTYINFVRHASFLPAFFNVLILLPLGMYMRYFRGRTLSIKGMLGIGFFVSLFFEVTQITGVYGIYTCPYRLFNVDDLILNTFGAVIGFVLAPIILSLFPSKEDVLEKSNRIFEQGTVRPFPQAIAIFIDYIVIAIIWFIMSFIFRENDPIIHSLFIAIGLFILQVIVPVITKGSTLGTKVMRFHLEKENSEKTWMRVLLKRWFAFMSPWFVYQLLSIVLRYSTLDMDSDYYAIHVIIQVLIMLFMFLLIVFIVIHVLTVILSKNRQSYYFDKISGVAARYKSTEDEK